MVSLTSLYTSSIFIVQSSTVLLYKTLFIHLDKRAGLQEILCSHSRSLVVSRFIWFILYAQLLDPNSFLTHMIGSIILLFMPQSFNGFRVQLLKMYKRDRHRMILLWIFYEQVWVHAVCLKQKTAQCATRAGAVSLCPAFRASGNLGQEKQQNKGMAETPGSSKWVRTAPVQFVVIKTFLLSHLSENKSDLGSSLAPPFLLAVIWGLHLLFNWLKLLPWKNNTGSYVLLTSAPAAATMRCFGTKNHFSHSLSLEGLTDTWSINFHCYWPD